MNHEVRWTVEKIAQRIRLIEPLAYRRRQVLPPFRGLLLPDARLPAPVGDQIDDASWEVIEPYRYWGQWNANFVLRCRFALPADWGMQDDLALFLPLGEAGDFSHPEALVYVDGEPLAACDRHHQEIGLPAPWGDGETHLLALHGWTGLGGKVGALPTQLFMRPCELVQIDPPTRALIATARVALGAARSLGDDGPTRANLLNALDEAFKRLDTHEPLGEGFYASLPEASAILEEGIRRSGAPSEVTLYAAGHAHIDVAWLWPLAQTRQKAARTFHTVLRLMERYPQYHFTQSQPQLYDFIRRDFPGLFAGIRARVAEGRWEPIGGMWVEADCNLSGPELLARQFLLGRGFFREHFGPGAEAPVLWLPDVFGYAWNLPQLIRQAGLEYFFTIKIGWNQYNRLPYDSFWWQGLDGTRVLTHFSTVPDWESDSHASTYNALMEPKQVLGAWRNFQQKELHSEVLMAFGYGDGGGGPTREMLENMQLMEEFPAMPRVKPARVADFFRRIEAEAGERLPVWNGELYFEMHRGTYTTQSRNKRANRKSEFLLHDAEFLAALASRVDPGYAYPAQALHRAWELVCLNQFHDIIPGSSVGEVYAESLRQYAEVQEAAETVRREALDALVAALSQPAAGQALESVWLVNPTGFARQDLAFWPGALPPGAALQRLDGAPVPSQPAEEGVWLAPGPVAPYSLTPLRVLAGESQPPQATLSAASGRLENDFLRVELNEEGDITRIYDKANRREVLPAGALANQFQAFEDRPVNWDAWDIDIFYDDRMWKSEPAHSVRVVEAGPLRATLEVRRRILHSDYVQRISLAYNSPRLDFDTVIQWQEKHILLKTAFPVEVFSPLATYEIQWGNVQRPTHRNTSWDWARFETCAQKWVDLSEGGYGVSLLNDCKYGHDIYGQVMRLSLLRSPTEPDPQADQGEQRFSYSLLPHAGSWDAATVAAAYALNDPWMVRPSAGAPRGVGLSFLAVDQPNVVIETVKKAEDGKGWIVRLYESQRRRGSVSLTAAFPLKGAWRTNLLEEEQSALKVVGNQVQFPIKPYEIVTLRLAGD